MKKLMTAVAIVCAAAFANAATVAWNSGAIVDHSGTALSAAGQVTAYLFTIDATTYNSYVAMSGADVSTGLWADYGEKLGTATATQANTYSKKAGGVANISAIDAVADTPVYIALLYVDTRESDTYFMGNVATMNWSGVGDPKVGSLSLTVGGDLITGTGATSWQTVPEPTSGLLMLLGMAGLALRRRRA
jgi:hypothetical protein